MTHTENYGPSLKVILIAAALVALLGLLFTLSAAEAADTESRLDRKIRVMERVLDEVLIQSPNVLVSGGNNARGLVLEGFGALFIVEGSLGVNEMEFLPGVGWPRVAREDFLRREDLERDDDDDAREPEDRTSWEELQKQSEEQRQKHLAGLRSEIIDALIDYGVTLGEIQGDRWVAVAAFLDGFELLGHRGQNRTRMLVKIKMRDLKSYSAGTLSRQEAIEKVVID
jgi:hypothetical protein